MTKKRNNSEREKSATRAIPARKKQKRHQEHIDPNQTPPGAQRPPPSTSTATEFQTTHTSTSNAESQKFGPTANGPTDAPTNPPRTKVPPKKAAQPKPANPPPTTTKPLYKKLPQLPPHTTLQKRPLHHPAPPTPFLSSASPKTLYLTASSPFVPTIKRIRKHLLHIEKRARQSAAGKPPLRPNGKLAAGDVEREIADDVRGRGKAGAGRDVAGEEVYVKATGRAIERALGVGVYFQGESDCRVRVEMGSVSAVDDVVVGGREEEARDDGDREGDVDMELGGGGNARGKRRKGGKEQKWEDEDIPETRVRTVSSITVVIGLK